MEMMIMLNDAGTRRDSRHLVDEAVALLADRLDGIEVQRCADPDCEICQEALPEAA